MGGGEMLKVDGPGSGEVGGMVAHKSEAVQASQTRRAVLKAKKKIHPNVFTKIHRKSSGKKWPYFGQNGSTSGKKAVSGILAPSPIHPEWQRNAFSIPPHS